MTMWHQISITLLELLANSNAFVFVNMRFPTESSVDVLFYFGANTKLCVKLCKY